MGARLRVTNGLQAGVPQVPSTILVIRPGSVQREAYQVVAQYTRVSVVLGLKAGPIYSLVITDYHEPK